MRIFVSYRRDDASAWAGRLHDALSARFGERNIFQDVAALRPGDDFTDAIETALSQSDVMLAVIGPTWLTATTSEGEARLARPDDYVRIELASALEHGMQVIPVLVGGATMPAASELPEGLEQLGLRQAVAIHDATWRQDVDGFIRSLRGESAATGQRRRLIGVGLAGVALLALAGAGWAVLRGSDDGGSGNPPGGSATDTQPSSPTGLADTCPTPSEAEWTDLGLSGETDVGEPGFHFVVTEADKQPGEDGQWNVMLRVEATQDTNASQTNYAEFYELAVEGDTYQPTCFDDVGGQNPMSPGGSSEILVGFVLPAEPTGGLALNLDTFGEFGRIELAPAAS
jgi:hypothetical protein